MKSLIGSFAVFFLLFSFSILFVSCSQESGITSPPDNLKSNNSNMQKVITTNNSGDTTIFLPLSKKVVTMPKGFTQKQISAIDSFIIVHNGKLSTSNVMPNALICNLKYVSGTLIDHYTSNGTKFLGIWDKYDANQWQQYYSYYGFSQMFIQGLDQYNTAINTIHFKPDSIMIGIPNFGTYQSFINGIPRVKNYYIDEPYESGNYDPAGVQQIATFIGSSSNLILSSYSGVNQVYFGTMVGFPNILLTEVTQKI